MDGRSCLVTGATGAVGPGLVGELLGQGYRVRTLARRPVPSLSVDGLVDALWGDLGDRELVARAVSGTDIVFHLAAKLHIPNPSPEMRAEYERVNVEGTRALVEAARAAGVKRLVLFSTVSVYGPTGPEPVDETAPPNPDTIYGETKLRAEQVALSATEASSGSPMSVVLRMAAIYGPRMKGNYVSLANALAAGRFVPVGNGANLRTLIHERDAVAAAILAAQHPLAAGRVYNVSDGAIHSLSEIMAAICGALGRRPPRLYVPLSAARLAAAMLDTAMAATGRPRRLLSAVDKFVESVAVRADRIQRELGFRPEYDLQRGWRETLAAMAAERGPAR